MGIPDMSCWCYDCYCAELRRQPRWMWPLVHNAAINAAINAALVQSRKDIVAKAGEKGK